jgi:hypothetical protein
MKRVFESWRSLLFLQVEKGSETVWLKGRRDSWTGPNLFVLRRKLRRQISSLLRF